MVTNNQNNEVDADPRFYPEPFIRKELVSSGIPMDKQDVITLLDLLPKRLNEWEHQFMLEISTLYYYTLTYIAEDGLRYAKRSGERLPDAVGAMVLHLLQRGLIAPLSDKTTPDAKSNKD